MEIHTIVHVVYALIMYAFWIQKPLSVQDATLIPAGTFDENLAILLYGTAIQHHLSFKPKKQSYGSDPTSAKDIEHIPCEGLFAWYGMKAIP